MKLNLRINACDRDRLESFLNGELSNDQRTRFHVAFEHLRELPPLSGTACGRAGIVDRSRAAIEAVAF